MWRPVRGHARRLLPRRRGRRDPRKAPRSRAVTLTVTSDGISYAEAMLQARSKVDLDGLGIAFLQPGHAVTGGIILEVIGAEGREKAAALATKMAEAIDGTGVRVANPVKNAELHIAGLDDSVTPEDVAAVKFPPTAAIILAAVDPHNRCIEGVRAHEGRRRRGSDGEFLSPLSLPLPSPSLSLSPNEERPASLLPISGEEQVTSQEPADH